METKQTGSGPAGGAAERKEVGLQEVRPGKSFAIMPQNFQELNQLAELIAKSDLAPKDFKGKPANALIAIQMGAEVGFSPMQAIQNIAVINGRPSMWGDASLALVQSHPSYEWIEETWDDKTQTARCRGKRRGDPAISDWTFSMDDARKAFMITYDNGRETRVPLAEKSTYKSYPRRMCAMRARAFVLRDKWADVIKGLAIREEVEDMVDMVPDGAGTYVPVENTPKRASEAAAPAAPAGKAESAPAATASTTSAPVISVDQRKEIFTLMNKKNIPPVVLKEWLQATYKIDSTDKIPADEYGRVVEWINKSEIKL